MVKSYQIEMRAKYGGQVVLVKISRNKTVLSRICKLKKKIKNNTQKLRAQFKPFLYKFTHPPEE